MKIEIMVLSNIQTHSHTKKKNKKRNDKGKKEKGKKR